MRTNHGMRQNVTKDILLSNHDLRLLLIQLDGKLEYGASVSFMREDEDCYILRILPSFTP